jgi:hypothetical protein
MTRFSLLFAASDDRAFPQTAALIGFANRLNPSCLRWLSLFLAHSSRFPLRKSGCKRPSDESPRKPPPFRTGSMPLRDCPNWPPILMFVVDSRQNTEN